MIYMLVPGSRFQKDTKENNDMSMLIGIIAFLAGTLIGAIIMALVFAATRSAEKEEELMNYIERGEHDGK